MLYSLTDAIPMRLGDVVPTARKRLEVTPLTAEEKFKILSGLTVPAKVKNHAELAAWQQTKFDEVMQARKARVAAQIPAKDWPPSTRVSGALPALLAPYDLLAEFNAIRIDLGLKALSGETQVEFSQFREAMAGLNGRRVARGLPAVGWMHSWGMASPAELLAWLKKHFDATNALAREKVARRVPMLAVRQASGPVLMPEGMKRETIADFMREIMQLGMSKGRILDVIHRHGVTQWGALPASALDSFFKRLYEEWIEVAPKSQELASLRWCVWTAAPVHGV